MPERPDSPIDGGKPTQPETEALAEAAAEVSDEQIVHHKSTSKKRKKGVGGEDMELQLTSMIDVIFQLLIYFVVTANFMIDEGTIIATMPGSSGAGPPPIEVPYVIQLQENTNGEGYTLVAGGQTLYEYAPSDSGTDADSGFSVLYETIDSRIDNNIMKPDRAVRIQPDGEVRWTHVVNVYNTCVRASLENVSFAAQ